MAPERDPDPRENGWMRLPADLPLPSVEAERDMAVIDAMRSLATLAEDMAALCRSLNDSLAPMVEAFRTAKPQSRDQH
jgi:hypothetical protein